MRAGFPSLCAGLALALGLGACSHSAPLSGGSNAAAGGQAAGGQPGGELVMSFSQFPDLPIPDDADMDVDRTLVFGGGEAWFGQLAISAPHGPSEMFDFYKRNLNRYGWQEVTSVRAPTSVLTHMRDERVLAIQISDAAIRGSEILLTVSPRERGNGQVSRTVQ
jgi:hypothetical protein